MDFTEIKETLEKHGFKVSTFETAQEAAAYLNREIDGTTVGVGGSMTIREMGLMESLGAHNEVIEHWEKHEGFTHMEMRKKAATAEYYLLSANALAKTGELINLDGNGNRLASSIFGHKKVFFVIGENKIADTYEEAYARAKNVACVENAKRLNCKTPCTVTGKCENCNSPAKICNAMLVLFNATSGNEEEEIVLVNEKLGY